MFPISCMKRLRELQNCITRSFPERSHICQSPVDIQLKTSQQPHQPLFLQKDHRQGRQPEIASELQKSKITWLPKSQNHLFLELFLHKSMQQEKAIHKKIKHKQETESIKEIEFYAY